MKTAPAGRISFHLRRVHRLVTPQDEKPPSVTMPELSALSDTATSIGARRRNRISTKAAITPRISGIRKPRKAGDGSRGRSCSIRSTASHSGTQQKASR